MNLFSYLTVAACLASLSLSAQKLPDIQPGAVWANSPLKVDGKLVDAAEPFQAYNKNTKLFYTLSNDDKNLYLVLKSTDGVNNNKILMGGITFLINASGKKKDKDASAITFPVIVRQARSGGGPRGQGGGFNRMGQGQNSGTVDSAAIAERRKQQVAGFKEIRVSGFSSITDSLISIYNEHGIKTAVGYDAKGTFIYELAMPLELAGIQEGKEFAYNIKVNGRELNVNFVRVDNGGGGFGGGGFGGGGRGNFDPSAFEPADFWGKYLPSKK